jgi:hypothetical protein
VAIVSACTQDVRTAFSVVRSAGLYSQLAGVSSALTFSVLLLGLRERAGANGDDVRGYRMLLVAFPGLLLTSILWGLIAGTERASTRADLLAIPTAWVTFVAALLLMLAIALLVENYGRQGESAMAASYVRSDDPMTRTARFAYFTTAVFGAIFVFSAISNSVTRVAGRGWYSNAFLLMSAGAVTLGAAWFGARHRLPPRHGVGADLAVCAVTSVIVLAFFAVIAAVPVGDASLRAGSVCSTGWTWRWILLFGVPIPAFVVVVAALARSVPRPAR